MHRRNSEICVAHLVGQPVDLTPGITEDDSLCDRQGVVEVAERVEFPFFFLYGDEVLLQTLERQLVTFDEDTNGISHELGCHVKNVVWQRGRDYAYLSCGRQIAIYVVNLFAEATIEEVVCFIENKKFDVTSAKISASNHVGNSTWCSGDNVLPIVELSDIFPDIRSSDASMALDTHVVAQCHHNRLNLCSKFTSRR